MGRVQWRTLYGILGTIFVTAVAAHFALDGSVLADVVDDAFAFSVVAVLFGWVHANRMALRRLDAPEDVDPEAEDRVMIPYDFR